MRFGGKRRPRHLTLRAQQSDSAARTAVAHAAKRYWRYSDEYLTASTVEAACQWVNPIFCRMPWGGRDSENGVLENGVYVAYALLHADEGRNAAACGFGDSASAGSEETTMR